MREQDKKPLVRGIILISNPFVILGVIALMLFLGWLTMGELTPLLFIVAGVYLAISVVGGSLAKNRIQNK